MQRYESKKKQMITKEAALRMMQSPEDWPNKIVLPVKRVHNNERQSAFLIVNGGPILYHGNIFDKKDLNNLLLLKTTEYETFEAAVESGWMVD